MLARCAAALKGAGGLNISFFSTIGSSRETVNFNCFDLTGVTGDSSSTRQMAQFSCFLIICLGTERGFWKLSEPANCSCFNLKLTGVFPLDVCDLTGV